jgi:MinD superfamily P-loop ATPase
MIISIASGKGGTGKTTVAVNLALSLEPPVQLLDCDVEEPNAHLFLQTRSEEPEKAVVPVPEIDMARCTGCGQCADICRFKAIAVVADTVLTFHDLCHSCGGCVEVCPEKAVSETTRELGTIIQGNRNGLELVYGRLRVGEAMSPPLIKKVRSRTRADRVVLIDAPPGTSCPVIAAIRETDFVLLVTEPTPFGLNDLRLAAGAVKILDIPCGLVINRSDMGNDDVRTFAQEENIPVLMEIPFDRRIAETYSRGEVLVDVMPAWKPRFQALYDRIREMFDRSPN